jgi:hypothetical protein
MCRTTVLEAEVWTPGGRGVPLGAISCGAGVSKFSLLRGRRASESLTLHHQILARKIA